MEQRSIGFEVNKKFKAIDIVRTARIKTSERLYKYSKQWEFILFVMSLVSSFLLLFSLIYPENGLRTLISSAFSTYSLLLQNFVSKMNYNERALKIHYHQLELESFVQELRLLLLKKEDEDIRSDYATILDKYRISLAGIENHSELDYKLSKIKHSENNQPLPIKKPWDWSLDNILYWSQYVMIVLVIVLYSIF